MRYRLGDPYTAHAAPFPTIEEAVAIFVRDHGAKPQTIVLPPISGLTRSGSAGLPKASMSRYARSPRERV